ncbi:MAG: DUF1499 domain-containing protein [Ahrensia sp.]|nr:DUF1499 domain-containing protein [Ahrensia sp.]
MTIIRLVAKFVLAALLLLALLFGAATLYGWEHVWRVMAGPADLGPVSFQGLSKTAKPNQALICPPDLCDPASIDRPSSIYDLPAMVLRERLLNSLRAEDDITRVDGDTEPLKLRFIQRTWLMRYPDTIRIEIVPIEDTSSTIALYSQSQIGESDLGVNLERAERWLGRLEPFERQ